MAVPSDEEFGKFVYEAGGDFATSTLNDDGTVLVSFAVPYRTVLFSFVWNPDDDEAKDKLQACVRSKVKTIRRGPLTEANR